MIRYVLHSIDLDLPLWSYIPIHIVYTTRTIPDTTIKIDHMMQWHSINLISIDSIFSEAIYTRENWGNTIQNDVPQLTKK